MSRPKAVNELIERLRTSSEGMSLVETESGSFARVTVDGEAEPFTLNPEECELMFADSSNVDLLHVAIGYCPADIELHRVYMEEDVKATLEAVFSVEEV